ncbi:MAG: hypothetical protein V1747_04820 [Candidatus Omnitrophota bacterium]
MKKYKIFLVLVMGFIAVQLSIEGLSFTCDQAEITERCFKLREFENFKLDSLSNREQKTEIIDRLFAITCLLDCKLPVFVFTTHKKCSVFVSELFNNSPPFFIFTA